MVIKINKIALRYAKALLRSALSGDNNVVDTQKGLPQDELLERELDRIQIALDNFSYAWRSNKQFKVFLSNPAIDLSLRVKLIEDASIRASLSPLATRFLIVILRRSRFSFLPQIADAYRRLLENRRRLIDVSITTAVPLSAEETMDVKSKLMPYVNGTPIFEFSIDPAIIGGIVVVIEGLLLDGSLRSRLDQLSSQLEKNIRV